MDWGDLGTDWARLSTVERHDTLRRQWLLGIPSARTPRLYCTVLQGHVAGTLGHSDAKRTTSAAWPAMRPYPLIGSREVFVDELLRAYSVLEGQTAAASVYCEGMRGVANAVWALLHPTTTTTAPSSIPLPLATPPVGSLAPISADKKAASSSPSRALSPSFNSRVKPPPVSPGSEGLSFPEVVVCFHALLHNSFHRTAELFSPVASLVGTLGYQLHRLATVHTPALLALLQQGLTLTEGSPSPRRERKEARKRRLLQAASNTPGSREGGGLLLGDRTPMEGAPLRTSGGDKQQEAEATRVAVPPPRGRGPPREPVPSASTPLQLVAQLWFGTLFADVCASTADLRAICGFFVCFGWDGLLRFALELLRDAESSAWFAEETPPECRLETLLQWPAALGSVDDVLRRALLAPPPAAPSDLLRWERQWLEDARRQSEGAVLAAAPTVFQSDSSDDDDDEDAVEGPTSEGAARKLALLHATLSFHGDRIDEQWRQYVVQQRRSTLPTGVAEPSPLSPLSQSADGEV